MAKKTVKTKAKMGRPRVEFDQEQFEKLCSIMATQEEICGWFDCDGETLLRWCKRTYGKTFEDIRRIKSAFGHISLRRKQFDVAMNGNVPMLIWLGKQILKQADQPLFNDDLDVPVPVFSIVRREA